MSIEEIIEKELWYGVPATTTVRREHNESLNRIEAAVTERIKVLENSVDFYEQLLDKAYDDFQKCVDNWDVREVFKELIEYAPRKNWEGK